MVRILLRTLLRIPGGEWRGSAPRCSEKLLRLLADGRLLRRALPGAHRPSGGDECRVGCVCGVGDDISTAAVSEPRVLERLTCRA